MPDLHITSTLLHSPAGATVADSGTSGADGFSSLLAGTIAAAPADGGAASDAAQAGLPESHAVDPTRRSVLEPALDTALAGPAEPGLDATTPLADPASGDGDAQTVPDATTQLLMALGIPPPPAVPQKPGTAAPQQDAAATAALPGAPGRAAAGAPGSAPTPAPGNAGDMNIDPAEIANADRDLPRPDATAPVAVAAVGLQKGARATDVSGNATARPVQGIQAPGFAAASMQQPIDPGGAAPAAAAAPIQLSLPQSVGSPAWRDAFSSSVSLMATQRVSSAELNLHPAELGPVQVRIRFEGGEASITCTAQHADTRAALDAALPRLREMLEASGIALGQASVDQQSPGSDPAGQRRDPGLRAPAQPEVATDAPSSSATVRSTRSDQLVDTFA